MATVPSSLYQLSPASSRPAENNLLALPTERAKIHPAASVCTSADTPFDRSRKGSTSGRPAAVEATGFFVEWQMGTAQSA